ncbi:hypothetical protein KR038_003914 [Drosophila bunnanda]|nr:hypothetical protein KR038_003914 [Drosophila bunnanda]
MTTDILKKKKFLNESIGDKEATDLPGINSVLGKRLSDAGFEKAYNLLGKFLVFKKDKEQFVAWMEKVCQANPEQASACYECLSNWCELFV